MRYWLEDGTVDFLRPLGFGRADVVVAVPDCWIDVARMADLEDVAAQFARAHMLASPFGTIHAAMFMFSLYAIDLLNGLTRDARFSKLDQSDPRSLFRF